MGTKNHQNNDKPYEGFRWRIRGHDLSLRRKNLTLWAVVPFMLELGTGLREFFELQERLWIKLFCWKSDFVRGALEGAEGVEPDRLLLKC